VEVCGDINVAASSAMFFVFVVCKYAFGWGFDLDTALMIGGLKIFFSYAGQFAHRQAHMPANRRPAWVTVLQNAGVIVSPDQHKHHHQVYDEAFPILSGHSTNVLAAMTKAVPYEYLWLAVFILLLAFDIQLFAYAHTALVSRIS